jgi:hypothetical protein
MVVARAARILRWNLRQEIAQVRNRQTGQAVPALVFFLGNNFPEPEEKLHDRSGPHDTPGNHVNRRGETLRGNAFGRPVPALWLTAPTPILPDKPYFRTRSNRRLPGSSWHSSRESHEPAPAADFPTGKPGNNRSFSVDPIAGIYVEWGRVRRSGPAR